MKPTVVVIQAERITDWASFHEVFAEALGFPAYYGRNMNAWIDCLTYADDANAGMIANPVSPGDLLTLRIDNAESFKARCPEQYEALIEGAAFVNFRRGDLAELPVIALLTSGWFNKP